MTALRRALALAAVVALGWRVAVAVVDGLAALGCDLEDER